MIFLSNFGDFRELGNYVFVSLFAMRDHTTGTILYPVFCINKIAPAFIAQSVKRAIAEHTIKIFPVSFVTGKILTLCIFIIRKVVFHIKTLSVPNPFYKNGFLVYLYRLISRVGTKFYIFYESISYYIFYSFIQVICKIFKTFIVRMKT